MPTWDTSDAAATPRTAILARRPIFKGAASSARITSRRTTFTS
jgi:hypothetical protein